MNTKRGSCATQNAQGKTDWVKLETIPEDRAEYESERPDKGD